MSGECDVMHRQHFNHSCAIILCLEGATMVHTAILSLSEFLNEGNICTGPFT